MNSLLPCLPLSSLFAAAFLALFPPALCALSAGDEAAAAPAAPETAAQETPAPATSESQSASAPEAPAKPSVYFLLQRVSVPVEGGLKGLPPGTRLRLVNDTGLKWQLMDSSNTLVEVEPALLTTDEETAKAMLISDQKAREAALAARAKAMKEAEAATLAERERHSKAVQEAAIPEKAGLTGESRLLQPAKK